MRQPVGVLLVDLKDYLSKQTSYLTSHISLWYLLSLLQRNQKAHKTVRHIMVTAKILLVALLFATMQPLLLSNQIPICAVPMELSSPAMLNLP